MTSNSTIVFKNSLGYKVSLLPKLLSLILSTVGVPHLGTRIRYFLLCLALKKMHLPTNLKVLDAGCGYGFTSLGLKARNFSVVGIDSDPRRIDVARRLSTILRLDIDFLIEDIYHLPFEPNHFDLCICFEVLEHLKYDLKALKAFSQIIKKGGYLFVSFPNYIPFITKKDANILQRFGHLRSGYTIAQFSKKAASAGFIIRDYYRYGNSLIGKLALHINFKLQAGSTLVSILAFPILYLVLIIDQYFPLSSEPSGFVVVLVKK